MGSSSLAMDNSKHDFTTVLEMATIEMLIITKLIAHLSIQTARQLNLVNYRDYHQYLHLHHHLQQHHDLCDLPDATVIAITAVIAIAVMIAKLITLLSAMLKVIRAIFLDAILHYFDY